jgi:hypothetical protein
MCDFCERMKSQTGDAGQRYEVSCLGFDDADPQRRKTVGWTNRADGGGLVGMINAHPAWHSPEVRDREAPHGQ